MKYCYIAIDKTTGIPVLGGPNKYNLTHAVDAGRIKPDEVKFYRLSEPRWPNLSKVVELSLDEVKQV